MKIRKALSLLAVAPVIVLCSPLHAALIDVTTTSDTVDPADGLVSLREAFQTASSNASADEISLAPGASYVLVDCVAGALAHTSADPIDVVGNGATIEQSCTGVRVIDNSSPGSALSVDSVTLTGTAGVGINGAGIFAAGSLALSNSTLTGLDGGFGAVLQGIGMSPSPSFVLNNVQILSNQGEGIRLPGGSLTLIDSTVSLQSSSGVALVDGDPVIVDNSTIADNGGLGIRTTGLGTVVMTLSDSDVTGNAGTGVACSACGLVTITDTSITGNGTAPGGSSFGGGLHISLDQDDPTDAPSVTVTNSHIDNNVSTASGGGIRIDILESDEPTAPPAQLVVDGSTINDNVADGSAPVHGGGIYVETGGIELINSQVNGNRAGPVTGEIDASGGGIYIEELGIVTATSNLMLDTSSVSSNLARESGGGIYWRKPGVIDMQLSSVDNNATAGSGGGLFAVGADTSILQSTVTGNSAEVGGGVRVVTYFDEPAGSLTVQSSTLANNTAASFAGAIGVDADGFTLPVLIENATISQNSATSSGGGILLFFGGELSLNYTTLVDNSAAEGANLWLELGGFVPSSLETGASIIALPGGGDNCRLGSDVPSSTGFNFVDDTSCSLGVDDVEAVGAPGLGPLVDNGGPTPTRMPAPDAAVAGLVPLVACTVASDQRGVARPQGIACEPGAVEIAESVSAMITGTRGDDVLFGTSGNDVIRGLGGNDVIYGFGGDDDIEGGLGRDLVFGGEGNDRIAGQSGRDVLLGGVGSDTILGGPGRDTLIGGPDRDTLDGGRGRDRCIAGGGVTRNC